MSDLQLRMFNGEDKIEQCGTFETASYLQRTSKSNEKSRLGILKIIFIILCCLLLVEGASYKFIIPLTRYPKIHFDGVKKYTEQELAADIYRNQPSSWFNFDTAKAAAALSAASQEKAKQALLSESAQLASN